MTTQLPEPNAEVPKSSMVKFNRCDIFFDALQIIACLVGLVPVYFGGQSNNVHNINQGALIMEKQEEQG